MIEIDPERRRLSLSLKRVEEGEEARTLRWATSAGAPAAEQVPDLGLSEEVFAEADAEAAAQAGRARGLPAPRRRREPRGR